MGGQHIIFLSSPSSLPKSICLDCVSCGVRAVCYEKGCFEGAACIILNLNIAPVLFTVPVKQGAEIWQDLLKGLVSSSDHPQIQSFCVDTHLLGLTVLYLWLLHLPH